MEVMAGDPGVCSSWRLLGTTQGWGLVGAGLGTYSCWVLRLEPVHSEELELTLGQEIRAQPQLKMHI